MRRLLGLSTLLLLAALATAPATLAHTGGKAEPRISAKAIGKGYHRTLVIRLEDVDTGKPIVGAKVRVSPQMTSPHVMSLIPHEIPEVSPGTYRAVQGFIMQGNWRAGIEVTGRNVERANAVLPVTIGPGSASGGNTNPLAALPTRLETSISDRDLLTMFVLWVHGLAAMGWIIGVILMTIALSTESLLAGAVRASLTSAYRRWGAWLHWSFVPLIVATGIYNMIYVTPFSLRRPWDSELDSVAYGRAYEGILYVKLALFLTLLASGTIMLLRIVRPRGTTAPTATEPAESAELETGPIKTLVSALGVSGVLYVATVPLILGAAMALRYVHILSHVAEVVNSS